MVEGELLVTIRLLLLLSRAAPHRCKAFVHGQLSLATALVDAITGEGGIVLLGLPTHLYKRFRRGVTMAQMVTDFFQNWKWSIWVLAGRFLPDWQFSKALSCHVYGIHDPLVQRSLLHPPLPQTLLTNQFRHEKNTRPLVLQHFHFFTKFIGTNDFVWTWRWLLLGAKAHQLGQNLIPDRSAVSDLL